MGHGGDEDGWSLGGEMFKQNKIVNFSKSLKCMVLKIISADI